MNQKEIGQAARLIWDYHHMQQTLKKADVIIVLGSSDIRVAEYASEIFNKGLAPYIVFSGGVGSLTKDRFDQTEAELFAETALENGVPPDKTLLEEKSSNTGENIFQSTC